MIIQNLVKLAALLSALVIAGSSFAQTPFKVGVIAPLTGPLAEYGLAAKNGIELARSEHPEKFSQLQFIYEDSQWDAKAAVAAFNKLRDSDQTSLIFNWGNPTTEAVAPLAERSRFPLIGMTLDPLVAVNKKYVIRSTNSAGDFASVLAAELKGRGYRRIGIVMAENTYVEGLFEGLKKALGKDVELEIIARHTIQEQDFRTSVAKLKSKKIDALGVFLISGQISNFYRQVSAQAITVPTFGTDFFESTTEIRLAGGGMNGAIYPHLGITENFRTAYVSEFKNDYQIAYAGNAYDMAMMLGKLFNTNSNILSSKQICERLRSVEHEKGVGGEFGYTETSEDGPHYHFPVQMKQVDGETIKVLQKHE